MILRLSAGVGAVRIPVSLDTLLLVVTLLCEADLVTVVDRELLPGFVLTTLLELEGFLGVANDFDLEEELRGVERTVELERFTEGVLLTDLADVEELFRELLLRTEVDLELLLLDPDFRCASTLTGAANTAIKIMIIYFFMVSGYYILLCSNR